MDVLYSKIIALALLLCMTLAFGLLPVALVRLLHDKSSHGQIHRPEAVVSYLMCFGGGVLLGTCMLHMIPELHETFEQAAEGDPRFVINYPIPELLVCAGFFLVYFIEEVAHGIAGSGGPHFGHSHETCTQLNATPPKRGHHHSILKNAELSISTGESYKHGHSHEHNGTGHVHRVMDLPESETQPLVTDEEPAVIDHEIVTSSYSTKNGMSGLITSYGSIEYSKPSRSTASTTHSHNVRIVSPSNSSSRSDNEVSMLMEQGSLHGLMLVAALSFHSIFEGMAVGLQGSNSGVWTLLGAISVHKLVLAFCVGLELRCMGARMFIITVYITIFAVMCPVGVAIGTVVMETSGTITPTHEFVIGSLQAIASGTLLYVTFFEVLQNERSVTRSGMWRLVFTLAGFALLAMLKLIDVDESPMQASVAAG